MLLTCPMLVHCMLYVVIEKDVLERSTVVVNDECNREDAEGRADLIRCR